MPYHFLNSPLLSQIMQAACKMFIHSLWQGLILTILTAITIVLTKRQRAQLRYNLITFLFFTFLSACLGTFLYEYAGVNHGNNLYRAIVLSPLNHSFLFINELQESLTRASDYCSLHADLIVITWFTIFLFKMTGTVRSLLYIRLLRKSKNYRPDAIWTDKVALLSSALLITKQVELLESAMIKIPVVAGYIKPIILVPLGLLANLPGEQVEAVLLHELAHIRRNDYCINFLQNIAEMVFFFNPALLWVSAVIKEERENCCDDIAIDHTKNKKQFLEALITFKEFASSRSATYAVAFPGKRNSLLNRFKRIVTNENKSLVRSERIFVIFSLVACAFLFTSVASSNKSKEVYTNKSILANIVAAPLTIIRQTNNTVEPKANGRIERNIRRRVAADLKDQKRIIEKQPAREIQELEHVNHDQINEKQELAIYISNADEQRQMQALLRTQESEKVIQKLLLERQQIEEKKLESFKDAQRAYSEKVKADLDLHQAKIAMLDAIRQKQQAEILSQQAFQQYNNSQHKE